MSNFKIDFLLKQHTPIVHFQSNQMGATLRATELKPKLDKFLLAIEEGVPFITNANGHRSLNYKVNITQNVSQKEKINPKHPLFFANMGLDKLSPEERLKVEKFFKFSDSPFRIVFFSYVPEVLNAINKHFEAFLAQTNFGTRQSKGLGCFYLADKTNRKNLPYSSALVPFKTYSFKSSASGYANDIKLLYSFLRQGINFPKGQDNCPETRFYAKPAIFAYAKHRGWTWDKKAIKQKFFPETLSEQIGCRNSEDVLSYSGESEYLLRDIFGLSSEQEWRSYGKKITKEGTRKEDSKKKEVAIQRFKSPITFKPILEEGNKMTVYFWANDTVNDILGEEFSINAGRGAQALKLKTPSEDEFSFDEFFTFAFNINLSQHISNEFHSQGEYTRLTKMYEDIKESK